MYIYIYIYMDIQLYPYFTITSSLHCCITIMIKYHNQFLHDIDI